MIGVALRRDGFRRARGNRAGTHLRAGQSDLKIENPLEAGEI
jgi:hypothetical protein